MGFNIFFYGKAVVCASAMASGNDTLAVIMIAASALDLYLTRKT